MKRLFYIFTLLILSSCSYLRNPVYLESYAIDYKTYTDQRFFITESNSVSFDYKPVSSVHSIFLSGYELKDAKKAKLQNDDIYGSSKAIPQTTNKYIHATEQKVIDELFNKAKSLNANALINLNIKAITYYNPNTKLYVLSGYEGSAMAVIR